MQRYWLLTAGCSLLLFGAAIASSPAAEGKRIVFIAGGPSHDYGSHEHYAGCLLLAQCLQEAIPSVETKVYRNGWPSDPEALRGAAAIVVFADGGGGNPILRHLKEVDQLIKQGVGLACIHYAVEVEKGEAGNYFKDWIGGHYELHWSVNPTWNAVFDKFPDHPVANGLTPFEIVDEWYYHMRFRDALRGVTPILSAVPPDATRNQPDGPHSGNPTVRAQKGRIEHLAWVCQRDDGGRGFGFTGGHWQWNWANDNFRKVVLNGIAWTAGIDIPPDGIVSRTPTFEQLEANQDFPQPANFDVEGWKKKIDGWNK